MPYFHLQVSIHKCKRGKWYCPFMFFKEMTPKEQQERDNVLLIETRAEMGMDIHLRKGWGWKQFGDSKCYRSHRSCTYFLHGCPLRERWSWWCNVVSDHKQNGISNEGLSLLIIESDKGANKSRMDWSEWKASTLQWLRTYKGKGCFLKSSPSIINKLYFQLVFLRFLNTVDSSLCKNVIGFVYDKSNRMNVFYSSLNFSVYLVVGI